MNTQAIAVERAGRRVLMSGLHGSWSIGSFAGAGIGAPAVGAGLGLTSQLLILGTIALLGAGLLTSRMLPDAIGHPGADERPKTGTRSASRWSGGNDFARGDRVRWDALRGGQRRLGVGLSIGTAARHGRCAGPGLCCLRARDGHRAAVGQPAAQALRAVTHSAGAGGRGDSRIAAGLAIGRPAAAIAGFVFLGIGLASVVPAVFSAAGRIAGLHPGTAVATVSACGWTGFVCGPLLIGQLASLASLSVALGLLPFLTASWSSAPFCPVPCVTLCTDQPFQPDLTACHDALGPG
jgi:hypothetical protein